MTETAIALEGVERRYGDRLALAGVTVSVAAGETLAVFGPNGAGKSTLLRILATLLRAHAGEARVLDAALPAQAWKVRGRVGYVGHDALIYRDLSVRENLLFYARLHACGRERIDTVLDAVGLMRRQDDFARDLSRGMLQRLAIARAVLHDPPLLLLDEPREGLDPRWAEALEPIIGRASARTRVLVSHDVDRSLAEADSAIGLSAGRQVFAGHASAADVRELYR